MCSALHSGHNKCHKDTQGNAGKSSSCRSHGRQQWQLVTTVTRRRLRRFRKISEHSRLVASALPASWAMLSQLEKVTGCMLEAIRWLSVGLRPLKKEIFCRTAHHLTQPRYVNVGYKEWHDERGCSARNGTTSTARHILLHIETKQGCGKHIPALTQKPHATALNHGYG